METVTIKSVCFHDRTLGFGNYKDFTFVTLELPWKNNKVNESCIPEGYYNAYKLIDHPSFLNCFSIPDVSGRSEIMAHSGNYTSNSQGCILIANSIIDIDQDGTLDVANSRAAINRLWSMLPDEFQFYIRRMI